MKNVNHKELQQAVKDELSRQGVKDDISAVLVAFGKDDVLISVGIEKPLMNQVIDILHDVAYDIEDELLGDEEKPVEVDLMLNSLVNPDVLH